MVNPKDPRCGPNCQGWLVRPQQAGFKETKEIFIMKNALDTIKAWAWGFIDLMLIFIAVGVLVQIIFGDASGFWGGMVGRLMAMVTEFSAGGFVGLIALVIVLSLFNRRTA